ncbi:polysaccharide deacetylase family protein [Chryseolinea sp. H1M3-3]|uniref:polysaccharide deacetylase family protein n=1 Tax=Chryseolinea sp. H1M3-3 TaxID=3034144 RepID=UPI0023EC5157|nr:polysaccharide deacetylase family protein [Chryseolinea sp. H1M3-3]
MIHRTPFFLPWLYPSLTWRIPADHKELFLSFDDGPVPGPTEYVLETLEKFAAKATFFCIGENIRKHSHVFKSIVHNGHAIGNHTYNHVNGWRTSVDEYLANIQRCKDEIQSQCLEKSEASRMRLFRPPYGRISRNQISRLSSYKIIMWDVLSIDYDKRLTPEKCLRNTIRASRSGSIIVFHDSYKAEKNLMYTLPRFIEHYSSLGFTFKAIE